MKPLSAEELLLVWENGFNYSLLYKTLLLLEIAYPEADSNKLAELSIGQRDTRLFHLRKSIFGSFLHNTIDCPECNSKMEWEMNLDDLFILPQYNINSTAEYELNFEDYYIRFRLPNSNDISEILSFGGLQTEPNTLLEQCILEIKKNKGKRKVNKLPEKVINDLSDKISELDPVADIRMNITCPNCGIQCEVPFDIMSYLWAEIDNWAHRTFQEVYILASSFGWSEKEVLNMDARRRQIYVEMINS